MKFELKPKDCHFRCKVNPNYCKPHELADYGTVTAEKAYRRGVGQTLAMLEHYANELGIDKALILRLEQLSLKMRRGNKQHDHYLHELFEAVIKQRELDSTPTI